MKQKSHHIKAYFGENKNRFHEYLLENYEDFTILAVEMRCRHGFVSTSEKSKLYSSIQRKKKGSLGMNLEFLYSVKMKYCYSNLRS